MKIFNPFNKIIHAQEYRIRRGGGSWATIRCSTSHYRCALSYFPRYLSSGIRLCIQKLGGLRPPR